MALGLRGEIRLLRSLLDQRRRFTDIAVRFRVYARDDSDRLVPTDRTSRVYGGCWDSWSGAFVGDATDVCELPCTERQFELATSEASTIEGDGGRGSGKSEGGTLWTIRHVVDMPGERGQVVAPTHDIVKIDWFKILSRIPPRWLLPGNQGIRRSTRELYFVHGHELRFRSADNPDSLRSWGGSYSWNDEDQDITTEANDIVWPSLRCTPRPQLCRTLTPKAGEPLERHKQLLAEIEEAERDGRRPDAHHFAFSSYSNCFISHRVFDLARRRMDARRFRQEIEADWSAVADEDTPRILHGFDRNKHQIAWPPKRGLDITREVVKRRAGLHAADYVCGVDYNWDWPNYALMFKVVADVDCEFGAPIDDVKRQRLIRGALADTSLQHWCVVDVISSRGSHAGFLGADIKKQGYNAGAVFVVDDASGAYNRKNSKLSSSKLLRMEGFHVSHPARNPAIRDAVNAVNAKLAPMQGEPTLHLVLPQCEELAVAAELGVWNKSGKEFDKTSGHDHLIDALKYVIHFFCPIHNPWPAVHGIGIR